MNIREEIRNSILKKIKDKEDPLKGFFAPKETKEAILAVLVAGRHLLLEGPAGIGKTTAAKIITSLLPQTQIVKGCRFGCRPQNPDCLDCRGMKEIISLTKKGKERFIRVQGSPELVPEDLIGDIDPVMAIKYGINDLHTFIPGKIQKANRKIIFVDELNRVPQRTQNTLLQVLEEGITTIAGFDIEVKVDTLIIATENPQEYAGVERISETLRDRFESIKIDYPTKEQELEILKIYGRKLERIELSENLMEKIVSISHMSRSMKDIERPASVRASLAIFEEAQSIAKLKGRDVVRKEDIKKALTLVLNGRIGLSIESEYYDNPQLLINKIIEEEI